MSKNQAIAIIKKFKKQAKRQSQPNFVSPMLAFLVDDYFDNKEWIYERKLDGERILTFKKDADIKLMSRNRKILNVNYPELVAAVKKQTGNFIIDGEVVAFSGKNTDFNKLQNRMHLKKETEVEQKKIKIYYYLFDVLYFEGFNVERLPLRQRKGILERALNFSDPLRYLDHIEEKGIKYHREACAKGWEGIIAKDGDSQYEHSRSKLWLKFKCTNEQELVVGGYTDPEGTRIGIGALLLGFYEGKGLKYAGRVGTGFDDDDLKYLAGALKKIKVDDNPFASGKTGSKKVHFVKPKLVAQVGFTEWTKDDKLRHPRYLGLRRDKNPREVIKERAK